MNSKTFTDNEKADICKAYRLAKDPSKQITALSELNDCRKSDIILVLQEAGLVSKKEYITSLPDMNNFKPVVPIGDVISKKKKHVHKWTQSELSDLAFLKAKGMSNKELASKFNVSVSAISGRVHLLRDEIGKKVLEIAKASDSAIGSDFIAKAKPANSAHTCTNEVIEFLEEFNSVFSEPLKLDSNSDIYSLGVKVNMLTSKADDLLRRLKSIGK